MNSIGKITHKVRSLQKVSITPLTLKCVFLINNTGLIMTTTYGFSIMVLIDN